MGIDFKVTVAVVVVGLALFAGGYYLGTIQSGAVVTPATTNDNTNPAPVVEAEIITCLNFTKRADAQSYLDNDPRAVPKYLDGDGDGLACEKLP